MLFAAKHTNFWWWVLKRYFICSSLAAFLKSKNRLYSKTILYFCFVILKTLDIYKLEILAVPFDYINTHLFFKDTGIVTKTLPFRRQPRIMTRIYVHWKTLTDPVHDILYYVRDKPVFGVFKLIVLFHVSPFVTNGADMESILDNMLINNNKTEQ